MINRDEYIVNGLSKIKHKKWELYVISRIIHQLDSDIGFSFQQLVKTKQGEYFYADLWFSNLNRYLEVDEDHHKKLKKNKKPIHYSDLNYALLFLSDGETEDRMHLSIRVLLGSPPVSISQLLLSHAIDVYIHQLLKHK